MFQNSTISGQKQTSLWEVNNYHAYHVPPLQSFQSEQPKGFKDFWFAFRSRNSGEKLFEYYPTEKKFQELAVPKGMVHLNTASSVQAHNPERPQQFCIEMKDGNVCFFEAGSTYEAQEWVSCLNAVLFGRGPNGGQLNDVTSNEEQLCS